MSDNKVEYDAVGRYHIDEASIIWVMPNDDLEDHLKQAVSQRNHYQSRADEYAQVVDFIEGRIAKRDSESLEATARILFEARQSELERSGKGFGYYNFHVGKTWEEKKSEDEDSAALYYAMARAIHEKGEKA